MTCKQGARESRECKRCVGGLQGRARGSGTCEDTQGDLKYARGMREMCEGIRCVQGECEEGRGVGGSCKGHVRGSGACKGVWDT